MASFCELCGKHTDVSKKVIIEKSIFNVCLSCSRRGKPVEPTNSIRNPTSSKGTAIASNMATRPTYVPYNAAGTSQNSRNLYRRKIISTPPRIKPPPLKKINMMDEMILDHEFPSLIRNARSKKGLTHDQLGQKINEKVTLIRKVETGSIRPDEILAKKLERFLGIKLYVNANEQNLEEDQP
ncbi:MAG: helix-turn-helix domain-containing protein [Candidatus Nitrosocosmicus sp.]|jgi:putative transcription factor|nr:TIGR00270 family protein [Candidatus Nitrosocosmicus sp.]